MSQTATKTSPTLHQLMLERSKDKYRLVTVALRWAYEVRQRDQSGEPPQEIMNQALREILTGQVKLEDIEKLPPIPKAVETKPIEPQPIPLSKLNDEEKPEKAEKGESRKASKSEDGEE